MATGQVRMVEARIDGQVNFSEASLDAGEGGPEPEEALVAHGLRARDGFYFVDGARARGEVNLMGLRSESGVSFRAARIEEGGLILRGAKIAYQLMLGEAGLVAVEGRFAVSAAGIEVGDVVWCDAMQASGIVDLTGARIHRGLTMHSVRLRKPLVLNGARIGGTVNLLNAKLDGDGEAAIVGRRLAVEGDIHCQDGVTSSGSGFGLFRATGEIHLPASRVNGRLLITGAVIVGSKSIADDYEESIALNLVGATIDELVLCPYRVEGVVNLRDLSVRRLVDTEEGEFYGDRLQALRLDGFSYGALRDPLDAETRLRSWIEPAQERTHNPGVFISLAEEFHRIGRSAEGRTVLIANQRRAHRELGRARRSAPKRFDRLPLWLRQVWHNLLYVTVGYGYRNWLALGWLMGLLVVGSSMFWLWEASFEPARAKVPPFEPLLYAIDVTVPFLDLGQQSAWIAGAAARWLSLALAVGGYVLATAVIAAATGLLNRDQR